MNTLRFTLFSGATEKSLFWEKSQQSKLTLLWIILFVLGQFVFIFSPAHAEQLKTVRVSYYDYDNLIAYDKEQKCFTGPIAEYLSEIAKHAGWEIEYKEVKGFRDCLNSVISGEADLTYGISKTSKREKVLFFSELPSAIEQYYLYAKKSNPKITAGDLSSFQGKTVGIEKESIIVQQLKDWCGKNSVKINIIEYTSESEKQKDFSEGKIDLDCTIDTIKNPEYTALVSIGSCASYYVVNKNRADLLNDLNKAQEQIHLLHPLFTYRLHEKYFSETTVNKSITPKEEYWLSSHNALRVGLLEKYMPFSYTDTKDQRITGFIPTLINNILMRLQLKNTIPQYTLYPDMTELCNALRNNKVDIIFPYYCDVIQAKKNDFIISKCKDESFMGVLYKGDIKATPKYDKIATLKAYTEPYFIKSNFPSSQILTYDSIEECIEAVDNDVAHCTIAHLSAFYSQNWDESKFTFLTLSTPHLQCFAAGANDFPIISLINKGVQLFSDQELNSLLSSYEIRPKLSLRVFLKEHLLSIFLLAILIIIFITAALIILIRSNRKLKRANSKIQRHRAILAKAIKTANSAVKAKTEFLFNMSHDIRTPMNAIIGFNNQALKNLNNIDLVKECLLKTQKSSELLLLIMNNVLDAIHITDGKYQFSEKPINLLQLFSHIEPIFTEEAKTKKINISFEIEKIPNPLVNLDVTYLLKILLTIISNALNYTKEGGQVRVSMTQEEKKNNDLGVYRFSIEDNGIGISEEFQKHLFEPFAREANSTTTHIQGVGLGLATCKKIIELMHGTITCKSKKGVGSIFTVILPLTILKEDIPHTCEVEIEYDVNSFKGKKVLIVEDNELNTEILADILNDEEIVTDSAENGEIAIEKLRQYGPKYYDCILMDIQMPVMNGYEATKAIRSMYPEYHIPIIAVSANAFEEDIKRSHISGMDAHLAKPVDTKLLFKTMYQYMNA